NTLTITTQNGFTSQFTIDAPKVVINSTGSGSGTGALAATNTSDLTVTAGTLGITFTTGSALTVHQSTANSLIVQAPSITLGDSSGGVTAPTLQATSTST